MRTYRDFNLSAIRVIVLLKSPRQDCRIKMRNNRIGVVLAGLEATAIGLHLADRIASLEDLSTLVNRGGWPAALRNRPH